MSATYSDRIDGIETSSAVKAPTAVATTANITLSGLQTVDGVALASGDRVLVKDQSNAVENGIWNASTGAWTRSTDFNGSRDVVEGTMVYAVGGSTFSNLFFALTTASPVIGSSAISFGVALNRSVLEVSVDAAQAYETRAEAIAKIAANDFYIQNAEVIMVSETGDLYQRVSGSTVIPDMNGWEPAGVLRVSHFGAVGDGVTNDRVALQLAGNYGKAELADKNYAVGTTVHLFTSGCGLIGQGGGFMSNEDPFDQEARTIISAKDGFTGTEVIRIAPELSADFVSHEQYFDGIQVNCRELAARGIAVRSTRATRIRGSSVFYPTLIGLDIRVLSESDWAKDGGKSNKATKHFEIDGFLTRVDGTAHGIVLDGCDNVINTNFGKLNNIYSQHRSGDGIVMGDCDGVMLTNVVTYRPPLETGVGMRLKGSDTALVGAARNNYLFGIQCSYGGMVFEDGTSFPSIDNVVYAYSRANASPAAVHEAGTTNLVFEDRNLQVTGGTRPEIKMNRTDPVLSAATVFADYRVVAPNASSNETVWGQMSLRVTDPVDGTENAQFDFSLINAGTYAREMQVGRGLAVGNGNVPSGAGTVFAENGFIGDYLVAGSGDDIVKISGGETVSVGARVHLYGDAHPTDANDIRFVCDSRLAYLYDYSEGDHFWYDENGVAQLSLVSGSVLRPITGDVLDIGAAGARWKIAHVGSVDATAQVKAAHLQITDGISAPGVTAGIAKIYVDTADGDLKIRFGDGTVKTIVTDT